MVSASIDRPEAHPGDTSSARHPLDALFYPSALAVIGATGTPGTVPYDIFYNILATGFKGTLYPVAPGKPNICAVRAYRYVLDIPDPIDLAVIVFPAHVVERALEQCGQKGIRNAVIISAGFREAGPKGVERERGVKEICRRYGINLIGPNCLGVINTDPRTLLNASFARKMPDSGHIGFLSQSGALCTAVLDYARDKQIGFSKFISFGNKAGLSEIDLLEYLHADEQTKVILLYLEEVLQGRKLVEAARRITRGPGAKPIIAIKSGRTAEGASAAASHTGALAGEDSVCDAIFQEAGIIRVTSIEEMFNAAVLYDQQPLSRGDRVAIITNGGGPGVMATDAAVRVGLKMARFEAPTTAKLKAGLPATANLKNPVDVIGDARADRYITALDAVLNDPNVDQVLVILTPQSMTDIDSIARAVCDVQQHTTKPMACSFMGATDVASGIRLLHDASIPHYILPEWACRAMADMQRYRVWREESADGAEPLPVDSEAVRSILGPAAPGYLAEDRALAVLKAYGLPVPPFARCASPAEAVVFAEQAGYPVVVKAIGSQIVHKTELGAVALNLGDANAVARAADQMRRRLTDAGVSVEGFLVRAMIPAGREVILGAKQDPSFGPVLMFGLGGVLVELFKDVTFAMAPLDTFSAARMLRRVKGSALLTGYRGSAPVDVPGLEQSLRRLGQLVCDFSQIAELDVNPLITAPAGNWVADARIRLSE